MKNLVILISCLVSSFLLSQEAIRIQYVLNYQPDSTDIKSKSQELMYLDILPTEKKSFFQAQNLYAKDSILATNPNALFGLSKPAFSYRIYKNHLTNEQMLYEAKGVYRFKINDSPTLEWKIDKEAKKEILGYSCQLATMDFRGRTYSAWYTAELPFIDGPYKFSGLPGVILEMYDTKKQYHFSAFAIGKLKKYNAYIDDTKYKELSRQDYIKFLNNAKENPSILLKNSGIMLPEEAYQKYNKRELEKNRRKNNPIELKYD